MKEKYLFLDFDGVITTLKSGWRLDLEKLELLGKIIDATDCKLVISSSWRSFTLENTIKAFSDSSGPFMGGIRFPFCDRIVGVTPRMYAFIHGNREMHYGLYRGVEIEHWLKYNIPDDGNTFDPKKTVEYTYCILDDDPDMLLDQKDYFIQTHGHLGLSEDDVKRVIEILNKGE